MKMLIRYHLILVLFAAYCKAQEGFTAVPRNCKAEVDLCFLIDASGSICDSDPVFVYDNDTTCGNWAFVLKFVYDFVSQVNIGSDGMRVAAIMFGSSAQLKWNLNSYLNRDDLLKAINKNLTYSKGENTNTVAALRLMASEVFNATDRPYATRTAIILTDGEPKNSIDLNATVVAIHERGISTYPIGISNQFNESILQLMSSPPHLKNVTYFVASSFDTIDTVRDQVLDQTCFEIATTSTTTTATIPASTTKTTSDTVTTATTTAPVTVKDFPATASITYPITTTSHNAQTITNEITSYNTDTTATSTITRAEDNTPSSINIKTISVSSTTSTTSPISISGHPSPSTTADNIHPNTTSTNISSKTTAINTFFNTAAKTTFPNITTSATFSNTSATAIPTSTTTTTAFTNRTASQFSVPTLPLNLTTSSATLFVTSTKTWPVILPTVDQRNATTSSPELPTIAIVDPLRGPIAGGTKVTIKGTWSSDIFDVKWVYIGNGLRGNVTDVKSFKDRKQVSFTFSTPETDTVEDLPVFVEFDCKDLATINQYTFNLSTSRNFSYLYNPIIEDAFPLRHLVSGGTTLTVVGSNLTSVAYPDIHATVLVCRNNQTFCNASTETRPCTSYATNSNLYNYTSKMVCTMPPLDLPEDFLDNLNNISETSSNVPSRRKRSAGSQDVQTVVGKNGKDTADIIIKIELDGYKGNDDFFNDKKFYFYKDPEIGSSHDIIYFDPSDKRTVEIKGKHMQGCCRKDDYKILLGDGRCNVSALTDNQLTCYPPTTSPNNTHNVDKFFCDQRFTIVVLVGNKIYYYRCLEYPNMPPGDCPADCWNNASCSSRWTTIALIVGLVFGLFIVIIVIILLICIIHLLRKNRKLIRQLRRRRATNAGRSHWPMGGVTNGSLGGATRGRAALIGSVGGSVGWAVGGARGVVANGNEITRHSYLQVIYNGTVAENMNYERRFRSSDNPYTDELHLDTFLDDVKEEETHDKTPSAL